MKKITCFVIICFLLLGQIAFSFAHSTAEEKPVRTVTVAFPHQAHISEKDEDDRIFGYTYDYMEKIASIANWEIDYILYPETDLDAQLSLAYQDVQAGKVDFVGGTLKNKYTEKNFAFPNTSYGSVYTTLVSLESNLAISDNNFMDKKPLRIAIWAKATTQNEATKHYCETNNIEYEFIECQDSDAQCKALENGQADVMVDVSLNITPYTFIVAQYNARPFYFATSIHAGNEALLKEMDDALQKIYLMDRYFERNTYDKHFSNARQDFYLSNNDQLFIQSKKVLKVAAIKDYPPFTYLDANDQLTGFSVEILNDFSEVSGLEIQYTILSSADFTSCKDLHVYDLLIGPPLTATFRTKNHLIPSNTLLSSYGKYCYHQNIHVDFANATLAAVNNFTDVKELQYQDIKYYKTPLDAMKGIHNGEADFGVYNEFLVDYMLAKKSLSNLKTLSVSTVPMDIAFYSTDDENSRLLSLVNKYIRSLDNNSLQKNLMNQFEYKVDHELVDIIENNPSLIIISALLFLLLTLVILFLVFRNKMVQKYNAHLKHTLDAKAEFLAKMSHDMRTPMNGIIGLTNISLTDGTMDDETRENLTQIDYSSQYLLRLINDTLDINKFEVNNLSLEPCDINLKNMMESMYRSLKLTADNKDIHIVLHNNIKTFHTLEADPVRFQQILFNLLNNALKFTPPQGTIKIDCDVLSTANNTSLVKIVIKDSGIGISKEFLPRLFEPFAQEHVGSKSRYGGTGLGLAISKNLVELMKGSLSCQSELNKGTTFTLILPFKWAKNQQNSAVNTEQEVFDFTEKRILLCEDHPLNQKIAHKLLSKKGAIVDTASDGAIGLDMFKTSPDFYYDAILMDIRMPNMDGL